MPFQIIRNDITKVRADAIVNTANPEPCVGRGTDSAVYAAAGAEELLAERKRIGEILPGRAVSTDAFGLQAKYIIHTVGPVWIDGSRGERDVLRSCYEQSLALAEKLRCESIAFPLISSGTYGFPKEEALKIALAEIGKFLLTHEMKVLLVVLDRRSLALSEDLIGEIDQYIDEHEARRLAEAEYGGAVPSGLLRRAAPRGRERKAADFLSSAMPAPSRPLPASAAPPESRPEASAADDTVPAPWNPANEGAKSLDELLDSAGETFQQRLFRLIDASGEDDVTVYKRANIDRKVFSRIRCRPDYRPAKRTAVAFAIALNLDMPATLDLLARAEYTFSPSSRFDLIISYFINRKIYDINEINAVLFSYGQPTLGE